ncbi:glycosyltransferase family 2 protein [Caldicellulosiruptoraceae bacterium PP1]
MKYILLIFILQWLIGFKLFNKKILENDQNIKINENDKISVIIPARNEEKNIPNLLNSLQNQTIKPHEIIVVNDFSEDNTYSVAKSYNIKVINNPDLPLGWTGKNWALWNGFLNSSGDILIFLDADVRLSNDAIETLIKTRNKIDGVISVVPFHFTQKFYERLLLLVNILGIFAFTAPKERKRHDKGLYGSCIVTTREDYLKINGHRSICAEVIDDLSLGKKFSQAGVRIENFIGVNYVSFRMYPNGIKSALQGLSKSAALSTSTLKKQSVMLIFLWLLGYILSGFITPILFITKSPLLNTFIFIYLLYFLQIIYFSKYTGYFGFINLLAYFLSSIFFIIMILYSFYQTTFLGHVYWKGREIKVGGKNS